MRLMPSFPDMHRFSLILLFAVVAAWAPRLAAKETSVGWDLVRLDGRDYVSLESVKRFYGFTSISRSGAAVALRNQKYQVDLKIGARECLMNGVKFVFSHPVLEAGQKAHLSRVDLTKLVDPVLRPNYIRNAGNFKTVILDPGHGGKDAGATNSLGNEANYNLLVAMRAKALLESAGYRVVMTRDTDRFLSLQERVDLANAIRDEAVFISIHFNSGGREARGIETFTLSPPGVSHYGRGEIASDSQPRQGNEHDSANIALATAIHGVLLQTLARNTFDRGIKRARFSVLSGVRHPAILLEGGFMSHPHEAVLIHNPVYREALARSVCTAVEKYRRAMSRKAPAAATNQPAKP